MKVQGVRAALERHWAASASGDQEKVAHETRYFADPFKPPDWRA